MTRLLTLLLLPLLLGACASNRAPEVPLPYRFTVGHIADGRTDDMVGNGEMMRAFPYNPTAFATTLRRHMTSHPMGSIDATVDVVLKHYEVTRFERDYALSMVVLMSGKDNWGRPLASAEIACSTTSNDGGFALDTYATQVIEQKSLKPLTMDSRASSMWYGMYDSCLKQTVRGYMQAVLTDNYNNAGNLNAGRPERAHE